MCRRQLINVSLSHWYFSLSHNPIYNCIKINKIPRNKFNQGAKRPLPRKLKDTEERKIQEIEAYTILINRKNWHCQHVHTTQHNSYQNTNGIFHRSRTNNSKIYMEPEKTMISHSNLDNKEQSWRNHATWYQTILQSHSNQTHMVLLKKKYGSMEYDQEPRNKPMLIWSINI